MQVLTALNFFASGSYQKRIGQDYLSCISQPTVSIILRNVVNGLNALMRDWIRFPVDLAELQRNKEMYVSQSNQSSLDNNKKTVVL